MQKAGRNEKLTGGVKALINDTECCGKASRKPQATSGKITLDPSPELEFSSKKTPALASRGFLAA
jgi:hypothetical protein